MNIRKTEARAMSSIAGNPSQLHRGGPIDRLKKSGLIEQVPDQPQPCLCRLTELGKAELKRWRGAL